MKYSIEKVQTSAENRTELKQRMEKILYTRKSTFFGNRKRLKAVLGIDQNERRFLHSSLESSEIDFETCFRLIN